MRLSPAKDKDLGNLNIVHQLILPHQGESEGATSKLDMLIKKMEPGSCLDLECGRGGHSCDGRYCVRIQSFQREDLTTWFGDITEKEKSEVQIVAECYASTTVNVATSLGFFSRMCGLPSPEMLESEHHLMTASSVESWPGVSVAKDPEAHQGMEDRSWGGGGISCVRGLQFTNESEVSVEISHGQLVRKSSSITQGDG